MSMPLTNSVMNSRSASAAVPDQSGFSFSLDGEDNCELSSSLVSSELNFQLQSKVPQPQLKGKLNYH